MGKGQRVPAQAGTQIRARDWVPAFAGTHGGWGKVGAPLLALALSACATAGPDYRPPEGGVANAPVATGAFHSAQGSGFAQSPLPDHWWRLYDDPVLDGLVEQALAANADLRAADANLARAQAVLDEAQAGRAISTDMSGGETLSRPSGVGQHLPGSVSYDLGLSAAYPLDLNGRIRRAIEAGAADVEASVAARDYVRVSVAAATARAYAQICAANYALAVNRQVVGLQGDTLNATRRLAKGGRGTAFDVSRAQAAVDASGGGAAGLRGAAAEWAISAGDIAGPRAGRLSAWGGKLRGATGVAGGDVGGGWRGADRAAARHQAGGAANRGR